MKTLVSVVVPFYNNQPYQSNLSGPDPKREQQQPSPPENESKKQTIDLDTLSDEEKYDLRREYVDKFLILQRKFSSWNVPLPSDTTSLEYVKNLYEGYVKQITIHQNSVYFRVFLIVLFLGVQFAGTKFGGLDLTGYAEMQITNMSKYEGALLELGEKYTSEEEGGEWPAEAKIAGLAVMQAVIFIGAKYAEKYLKIQGISGMIHKFADSTLSNLGEGGDAGPTQNFDARGHPIVPGMEKDIENIESKKTFGNNPAPKSNPAPAADLSGMVGSFLSNGGIGMLQNMMGGGGGGGGGLDIGNMVGSLLGGGGQNKNADTKQGPFTAPPRRRPPKVDDVDIDASAFPKFPKSPRAGNIKRSNENTKEKAIPEPVSPTRKPIKFTTA